MEEQVKITIIVDKGYIANALDAVKEEIVHRPSSEMYNFEVENYHHLITVEEIF